MKQVSNWAAVMTLLVLAGCAAPSTTIQTPMTARPVEREAVLPHNGAIFQAGRNEHPLFEDKRARNVGDVLTINIVEATKTNQSTSNSSSHAGNINIATPTITRGTNPLPLLNPYKVTDASSGSLDNKSSDSGAIAFNGAITVTVIEVLPNGNLVVAGEKVMSLNQNNEYLRLSGVVDPTTMVNNGAGFVVQSSQVADAHIEFKGSNNNIDKAQLMGMLGRAFLSVLPF